MRASSRSGPTGHVLVIEDDPVALDLLVEVLRRVGHDVSAAADADAALEALRESAPDVVVTDVRLGEADGIALLPRIRELAPRSQVIVVTAFGTLATAVQAVQAGAFDYLSKPFGMDEVVRVVARALKAVGQPAAAPDGAPESGASLVGRSPAMTDVFKAIARVSPLDSSVLVLGETGTGKELVARAIHDASPRRDRPYVAVNCPSLPEGLFESELFGHRRGAFTSAQADHTGLFRAAHGGSILLDEIGDLPLSVQAKLLRVLESGEVRPVGAAESVRVDVRLMAATHQDLPKAVEAGRFRQDLLYRLNTVTIELPPLRERIEDLELLIDALLARLGRASGGRTSKDLSQAAMAAMRGYAWPGNVRELLHVLERAAALSPSRQVDVDDLPRALARPEPPTTEPRDRSLREVEREHILAVLGSVHGHRARAAAILGIDRKTLYRKLREYGLISEGAAPELP